MTAIQTWRTACQTVHVRCKPETESLFCWSDVTVTAPPQSAENPSRVHFMFLRAALKEPYESAHQIQRRQQI